MICPTCLPPNRWSLLLPAIFSTILFCALAAFSSEALATEVASSVGRASRVEYPIQFSDETLSNGLRVIYAPLHNAPVVHVRVFYHVGSRDERSDRQGFAHMFEHMMFRGSAHVAPQEHMTLVNGVGGICNAFTSFDKTVYFDTVPAEDLEMVLYLEADRMSSFKVSQQIYQTERKVVAEEWRMRQNKPYGTLYEDFLKAAFTTHSYRWTPIGNMQHLLAAPVSELQDFFNTYYVPNNAVLVIAGDFDDKAAHQLVRKYFEWIPRGGTIPRLAVPEPPQTKPRRARDPDFVPLPAIVVGWHIPPYRSDDQYALSVLSAILGEGASSRLSKLLVNTEHPTCVDASTILEPLEDGGIFGVSATILNGKNPADVERTLDSAVASIVAGGVRDDELAKAKTVRAMEMLRGRETAEAVAGEMGEQALIGGDASRANSELAKLNAVTGADVQAVATKYLLPTGSTTLLVTPDPLGVAARKSAAAAAAITRGNAPVAASTQPIAARLVHFPEGYPEQPPLSRARSTAAFEKGQETRVNGVRVIVMSDHRLPLVNWTVTMQHGSHGDPDGKEGMAALTAAMLRRGGLLYLCPTE